MCRNILIALIGWMTVVSLAEAQPDTLWTKIFGGVCNDYGYSAQQTTDSGYIIAGKTWSYGAGGYDVYLIKTNTNGNQQWIQTFGGIYNDCGFSVQQTSDGGYIVAGWTSSYGGLEDVYLIKADASGIEQWSQTFGGGVEDYGFSVQQTSDGGYIVAGMTWSYGAGDCDVWLIKISASGMEQWNQTFGGSDWDCGYSVQQTTDGGYIVAGSTTSYGTGPNSDVYLIKTDNSGIEQWSQTFGGDNSDYGYSVQQTSDGGYIVAGSTQSYGGGGSDVYLIKTNASGMEQWSQTLGGTSTNYGHSVQQTSDGGYIVAGYTDPNGAGVYDVWLICLASEVGVKPQNPKQTYEFQLIAAYPNPFNLTTNLRFELRDVSFVGLFIYDISGRPVAELVNGWRDVGHYHVTFDASGLASGLYIARFQAGDYTASQKMVLVK